MNKLKSIISVLLTVSIVFGTIAIFNIYSSAAANLLGDANSDGAINSFDALTIIRHSTGEETLTAAEVQAADVDGSGAVNSADALYVLHYAVGKINTFPTSGSTPSERVHIVGDFWYDPATGQVTNTNGSGLLGFSYSADEACFYASLNSWQRNFGYTYLYDYAAPLAVIYYDTSRIFFDYDGKEWMVQLWKGQYGWVLIGCEIGLYYRDFDDETFLVDTKGRKFYKCAEDEMLVKMSLSLYKDGQLLFHRKQQYSWWLTGFIPGALESFGINFDTPQALTVDTMLTFENEEIMDAFIGGLKNCTEVEHNSTKKIRNIKFEAGKNYTVNRRDRSVSFTWN